MELKSLPPCVNGTEKRVTWIYRGTNIVEIIKSWDSLQDERKYGNTIGVVTNAETMFPQKG
jgi:hypothetical protein